MFYDVLVNKDKLSVCQYATLKLFISKILDVITGNESEAFIEFKLALGLCVRFDISHIMTVSVLI